MSILFEAKDLKKYFNTPAGLLHAVDGVSFKIEEGETLGVVGESGCGKSTLGRLIIHLLEPTGGQMFYEGKDVTKLDAAGLHQLRNNIQMIFQDPFSSLNPRMTIGQTLSEVLVQNNICSKKEAADRVYEIMDTVGLARRLINTFPHELDGGRRQRIGIARAIALNPKFIICDEPVSALDVSIQAQIINLLLDLQEQNKLSYVFVTHDLSVVKYISHKVLVMYLGQMVELTDSKSLFANPLHPYTKALLSAVPIANIHVPQNRIKLKGELTSPIDPKPGCRFAPRCPYASEKCFTENPDFVEAESGHFVACHMIGQA